MLKLDVIHKLDLIAYEGWEYHKLPPEKLDLFWPDQENQEVQPTSFFPALMEFIWDEPSEVEHISNLAIL